MTSNNYLATLTPAVKLAGAPLPDEWTDALVDVRVELEMRVPGRCTMRFADEGYVLAKSPKLKLGAELRVEVYGTGQVLFVGEVTGFTVDQEIGSQPELVLVAHDRGHRLGRGSRVSTYLKMTYSDIVKDIADRSTLTA